MSGIRSMRSVFSRYCHRGFEGNAPSALVGGRGAAGDAEPLYEMPGNAGPSTIGCCNVVGGNRFGMGLWLNGLTISAWGIGDCGMTRTPAEIGFCANRACAVVLAK